MDKQAKQFSIPIPEVNFRCLLPLSKRLIERSDVYEKLTGGRIAHPDLVIPHSILSLSRTLMYSGDIFLASHIITFAVLFWCCAFHFHQGMLRETLANEIHHSLCSRNMEDTAHYISQLLLYKVPHENFLTKSPPRKGCVSFE